MKKSFACRDTALPKISWCKTCQHFEEGVEFERERIIKLLEKMDTEIHYTTWFDAQGNIMNHVASPETLDREKVFALIKGENNE